MDIRDKVQIDAIKDREEYSICEYGTHVLIYNGTYGVYVPEEILMLNPKRYEKNEDLAKLNPYDVVDETRSATIIKESITFSGEIANAVIDFGREKTWIWQSAIKKFGKRRMYGVADVHMEGEEKKIVVVMDAEGNDLELDIQNGKVIKKNYVGRHIQNYDSMLVLSHFKGHPMGGFGGALKQLSIGVASSSDKGKDHLIERIESRHSNHIIDAAANLKFGTKDYELINIDNI